MIAIQPRAYQRKAIDKVVKYLDTDQPDVVVVSPPGSGKTVMIADLAKRALGWEWPVVILAHTWEILNQNFDTLVRLGVPKSDIGMMVAKGRLVDRIRPDAPIQIVSKPTAMRRKDLPEATLVIIDETQHAPAEGYSKLLQRWSDAAWVGFTATPIRLDGKGLDDIFIHMIIAAFPSELIRAGHIARPRLFFNGKLPDLSNLKVVAGDFALGELQKRVDKPSLTGNIVKHYLRLTPGIRTIAFAVGIEHAKNGAAAFRRASISSEHIDGKMSVGTREAVLERFRSGQTQVLWSVGVLAEGYDLPSIGAIILARPTMSLALYLQQTGRVMRKYGRRRPILLDHAGHCQRFALAEADRKWTLAGNGANLLLERRPRVCGHCGFGNDPDAKQCDHCDHKLERAQSAPRDMPAVRAGHLMPYTEKDMAKVVARIRKIAKEKGWDADWADAMVRLWAA